MRGGCCEGEDPGGVPVLFLRGFFFCGQDSKAKALDLVPLDMCDVPQLHKDSMLYYV